MNYVESMKLALEALEESHPEAYRHVITTLRTAIEAAEKRQVLDKMYEDERELGIQMGHMESNDTH